MFASGKKGQEREREREREREMSERGEIQSCYIIEVRSLLNKACKETLTLQEQQVLVSKIVYQFTL